MSISKLRKVDIPGDTENIKLKTLQSRSRDIDKENITIQELGGERLSPFNQGITNISRIGLERSAWFGPGPITC
ncbi:15098_t:CDS:2, partial [Funneliformis geosporum]